MAEKAGKHAGTVTEPAKTPAQRVYRYLGDRLTAPELIGRPCFAVLDARGKCIRGRGTMSVRFVGEREPRAVLARRLRRVKPGELVSWDGPKDAAGVFLRYVVGTVPYTVRVDPGTPRSFVLSQRYVVGVDPGAGDDQAVRGTFAHYGAGVRELMDKTRAEVSRMYPERGE